MSEDERRELLALDVHSSKGDVVNALRKIALTAVMVSKSLETFAVEARTTTPLDGWTKPSLGRVNGKRKRNPDRWR